MFWLTLFAGMEHIMSDKVGGIGPGSVLASTAAPPAHTANGTAPKPAKAINFARIHRWLKQKVAGSWKDLRGSVEAKPWHAAKPQLPSTRWSREDALKEHEAQQALREPQEQYAGAGLAEKLQIPADHAYLKAVQQQRQNQGKPAGASLNRGTGLLANRRAAANSDSPGLAPARPGRANGSYLSRIPLELENKLRSRGSSRAALKKAEQRAAEFVAAAAVSGELEGEKIGRLGTVAKEIAKGHDTTFFYKGYAYAATFKNASESSLVSKLVGLLLEKADPQLNARLEPFLNKGTSGRSFDSLVLALRSEPAPGAPQVQAAAQHPQAGAKPDAVKLAQHRQPQATAKAEAEQRKRWLETRACVLSMIAGMQLAMQERGTRTNPVQEGVKNMTNAEFQDLCRATSLALDIEDTQALGARGQVELDGVTLGVFYNEDSDAAISCYVDLGEVEPNRKLEMFEQALELNLELGRMHGETVGLDPETGRMVLRCEIQDPDRCSSDKLAGWLRDYAAFAREFQASVAQGQASTGGALLENMLA